jgi:cytochrome P450
MTKRPPVTDWTKDFDVLDPAYLEDPFSIWDDLRKTCPIAHTDRRGGAWLLTTYADVAEVAHDIDTFSSLEVGVIAGEGQGRDEHLPYGLPPISSDPPLHTWTRRLLLPWFSHSRVGGYEAMTRDLCRQLIDGFIGNDHADAASDYAQQIPVRVIAKILGVPEDLSDTFTGWVRDVLEFADEPERVQRGGEGIFKFLFDQLELRKDDRQDDLISELVHTSHDDVPLEDSLVLGIAGLVLIAGIDTTWSAIGSTLWHLANHPEDAARLVAEPDLLVTAVEEFLRVYSPVTMARVTTTDAVFNGCPMAAGDRVLLNFPAANRDPAAFERADEVVLDRAVNRHIAFGTGIHRCAGSNLARMELTVAVEEWLARIPTFRLAEDAQVTWAGGQVRGPRSIPVMFP